MKTCLPLQQGTPGYDSGKKTVNRFATEQLISEQTKETEYASV